MGVCALAVLGVRAALAHRLKDRSGGVAALAGLMAAVPVLVLAYVWSLMLMFPQD